MRGCDVRGEKCAGRGGGGGARWGGTVTNALRLHTDDEAMVVDAKSMACLSPHGQWIRMWHGFSFLTRVEYHWQVCLHRILTQNFM